MNTIRPCGCKGVRSCLQCEKDFNISKSSPYELLRKLQPFSYCTLCSRLYEGWDPQEIKSSHPYHNGSDGMVMPGIVVQEDFIAEAEATQLLNDLDSKIQWNVSQSGRRKQNFGPKTNFKKRKLQNGTFAGFPKFTEFIQQRFNDESMLLRDFQSIEQCSLEYDPQKGASIDAHIDDCWIWGERVVTVNCLGDSVLSLTLFDGFDTVTSKYNLDLVSSYADKLIEPLLPSTDLELYRNRVIRIPMPNRSLIILYGPPRYQFEHAVLREDVQSRRVCIAYREFTPFYLGEGELKQQGQEVIKNAIQFWDTSEEQKLNCESNLWPTPAFV